MSEGRSSSFYWAMRLLPQHRRAAMFALYGYCRVVDDIADAGERSPAERRAALDLIRTDLATLPHGRPDHPCLRALQPVIAAFALPVAELSTLVDGMAMDIDGPSVAPGLDELQLYCRRVAGSVGLLSVRIFGRADADAFALLLGEALQLTNILRDVAEDAGMGRLYLPQEALDFAGIQPRTPQAVLADPHYRLAWNALADLARTRFRQAETELRRIGHKGLWPALAMMAIYGGQLKQLEQGREAGPAFLPWVTDLGRLWLTLHSAAMASAMARP